MSESFLHYIWQYQYFNAATLKTASGENISIFEPGMYNTHAGPDFQNSRIKINDVEWVGCVEIHINASEWFQHHHQTDTAYENVVLHVVWNNDKPIKRNDGSELPVLELKNRIEPRLLMSYKKLVNNPLPIPCADSWMEVADMIKVSMFDRTLSSRLESKALAVANLLKRNNGDWQETTYQVLAKNFGFKVNAEPFLQLAQSLPYKLLLKHADQQLQLEALLLGQAGLLDQRVPEDDYVKHLQREYKLLSQKYDLVDKRLHAAQFKFLRLRPANFPTVRLAQLAALFYEKKNIFSALLSAAEYADYVDLFRVQQSPYWQQHYTFSKKSEHVTLGLGESSINNVLINSVVPLLAAYGRLKDDYTYVEKAIDILQRVPPEQNVITRQWEALDVKNKNSFDSQASIELYNNYCLKRRCLDCKIGAALVKPIKG